MLAIMTAITLQSITACSKCASRPASSEPNLDIYVQLYSLRDDIRKDVPNTLANLANMGVAGVELYGYDKGGFFGYSPQALKKLIEQNGMHVLSSHVNTSLPADLSGVNWDKEWEHWDEVISAHQQTGLSYIVIASMPVPADLKQLHQWCDFYNRLGEKVNAAGLSLGYHNHDFEYKSIDGEVMYDYLLKNVKPENMFFQMDVYWTVVGGYDPVSYFKQYPGRFKLLHLKDAKELGASGNIDFKMILQHLKTAGTHHMIAEVEHYSFAPIESVNRSVQFLKELLSEI